MSLEERIKEQFSKLIGNNLIPGISVSLFHNKSNIIFSLGKSDIESGADLKLTNYFEIASLTKTFIAILFSKLHLEKRISIQQHVEEFIPQLTNSDVGKIKLIDLLTHTSGLNRLPNNFKSINPQNPYQGYSREMMYEDLCNTTLHNHKFLYSNLGFALLGQIIESKFKTKLSKFMRDEVLRPLSIEQIRFSDENELDMCIGYSSENKRQPNWTLENFEGAGGMRASITLMSEYLKANIWPENSNLKDAIQMAHTVHKQSEDMNLCLAWFSNSKGNIVHDGATYGFQSFMEFSSKTKQGIVVLANSYNNMDKILETIDECYKIINR